MDITKIQFRTDLWDNQNKMVLLVVEDIRKEGQAWQEIENKKHRKTEEVEYCCPHKT
jgi:hypothetical protein